MYRLDCMKMKKRIVLLFVWIGSTALSFANDGCNQHLSPEEFRAKQKAFITQKADLTAGEAEKFFPLYFELQDKKKNYTDEIWKLLRKSWGEETMTDAQYEEILLKVYDLRIESDKLDKVYYTKFKKVLSPQKIFQVQKAEARFHRELLKGVKGDQRGEQQSDPRKNAPPPTRGR